MPVKMIGQTVIADSKITSAGSECECISERSLAVVDEEDDCYCCNRFYNLIKSEAVVWGDGFVCFRVSLKKSQLFPNDKLLFSSRNCVLQALPGRSHFAGVQSAHLVAVHHEVVRGDERFENHYPTVAGRPLQHRVCQVWDADVQLIGAVDQVWKTEEKKNTGSWTETMVVRCLPSARVLTDRCDDRSAVKQQVLGSGV